MRRWAPLLVVLVLAGVALAATLPSPRQGGTGASNTATLGSYLKGDGTNFVTSSGGASGVGTCAANQFETADNSDAAPTCSAITCTNDTVTACLTGRSGGQTLDGGTGTSDSLTVRGSAGASQPLGPILLNDDASGRVGIGSATPIGWLDVTTPVMTGVGTVTSSGGTVTLTQVGGEPKWNTAGDAGQLHVGDTLTAANFSCPVTAIASDTSVTCIPAPQSLWSNAAYTWSPAALRTAQGATGLGVISADGRLGLGTITPSSRLTVSAFTTPPSVSSGTGLAPPPAFTVTGTPGGATSATGASGGSAGSGSLTGGTGGANTATDAAGNAGGAGGGWTVTTGAGGGVSHCLFGCTPGNGGALQLTGNAGGPISAGAGGSTAGTGSTFTFKAGNGGAAVAGNTNGTGGAFNIDAGNAGAGAGTAGVKGQVKIGLTNASPVNVGTGGLRIGDTTVARTALDVQGYAASAATTTSIGFNSTLPTQQRLDYFTRHTLTGAARTTAQGTTQLRGHDENKNLTLPLITATQPDVSFTLPTLQQRRFYTRWYLTTNTRGTFQGNANLRGQNENENDTLPFVTATQTAVNFTVPTLNQRRFFTRFSLAAVARGAFQGNSNLRGQNEGQVTVNTVSPGSLLVASGQFRQYARRQYLQGNARITLQGSGFLCGMRS